MDAAERRLNRLLPDDAKLRAAIESVAVGCRVASAVQAELERVRQITKDDRSPVTVADFAVQAVVARALRQRLGDVLIVGEENADALRDDDHALVRDAVVAAVNASGDDANTDEVLDAIASCAHDATASGYWTLDPIDGTKGFLRGQQFAIALGWIEDGRVLHGAMGCPNLPAENDAPLEGPGPRGVITAASVGRGAWQMASDDDPTAARRIHAANRAPGEPVRVCESVEAAHSSQSNSARIVDRLGEHDEPVRLDSQAKYTVVARGQADAYLRLPTRRDYVEKIWDHAAGAIVATEAGAIVSDVTGAPLDFSRGPRLEANRGVICAGPALHGAIIEAISGLGIADS